MLYRRLLAAALVLCSAMPVAAETLYRCEMKANSSRDGGVSPLIFITYDEARQTATVIDVFVNEVYGEPIPVELRVRDANRVRLKWKVDDVPLANDGSTTLVFSATLNRANGQIRLNTLFQGYDNNASGRGTCAVQ